MLAPNAFQTQYAPRLRGSLNSLLAPIIPAQNAPGPPASRTTKRGTVVINYSEDLLQDDDFDESDGPRRSTGLRSRREDSNQGKEAILEKLGKELKAPVEIQGAWRDWVGKSKFQK
jgi:chromatin structure-remodeling complex subunit SFH1